MKKILILSSVVAALICFAGITYYLAIHLPVKQRAELYLMQAETELEKERLQTQEKQEKENKLTECLEQARNSYAKRREKSCKKLNEEIDEDGNCWLPSDMISYYESVYKDLREECLKRYK
mgnify:CR=1 FL=1